jgi:hypothetical protein
MDEVHNEEKKIHYVPSGSSSLFVTGPKRTSRLHGKNEALIQDPSGPICDSNPAVPSRQNTP